VTFRLTAYHSSAGVGLSAGGDFSGTVAKDSLCSSNTPGGPDLSVQTRRADPPTPNESAWPFPTKRPLFGVLIFGVCPSTNRTQGSPQGAGRFGRPRYLLTQPDLGARGPLAEAFTPRRPHVRADVTLWRIRGSFQKTGNYRRRILQTALITVALAASLVGMSAVPAAGKTTNRHGTPVTGYAYVCDGVALVQEVVEHNGDQVVVTDNVEEPNSANNMFEVFQSSRPEKCAALAAPFSGAVPGTLLVAVSWATPNLGVVRRTPVIEADLGNCRRLPTPATTRKGHQSALSALATATQHKNL
jgi:hypothetical protein